MFFFFLTCSPLFSHTHARTTLIYLLSIPRWRWAAEEHAKQATRYLSRDPFVRRGGVIEQRRAMHEGSKSRWKCHSCGTQPNSTPIVPKPRKWTTEFAYVWQTSKTSDTRTFETRKKRGGLIGPLPLFVVPCQPYHVERGAG